MAQSVEALTAAAIWRNLSLGDQAIALAS